MADYKFSYRWQASINVNSTALHFSEQKEKPSTNLFLDVAYLSYRQYLKDRLESQGLKSGLKKRAAEALSVHTTFISQVVLDKADFSLDQAEKINQFFQHNDEESEYFLELVIYERAGNPALKQRFEKKIRQRHLERVDIKKRLTKTKEIALPDQDKFYSSHLYGLIHVLTSIPEYRTRRSLTSVTGFPQPTVDEALDFLVRVGIVMKTGDQYLPGEKHIHLGRDSKNIWRHHTNWRTATIQHLAFASPEDLHYSLSFSCSEQDAQKLKESLLAHLKKMTETISSSKEEKAYVFCFDFFRWT